MTDCADEQQSKHRNSPGLVGDGETVCRGVYDPIHFNRSGAIKSAFLRPAHLLAGELSVWRLQRDPAFDIHAVVAQLEAVGPANNTLERVVGATAGIIRQIRLPDHFPADQRVFCVLDDCTTDDDGGWHSEHATIAMAEVAGHAWQVGDERFDAAREGLATLLMARRVWPTGA